MIRYDGDRLSGRSLKFVEPYFAPSVLVRIHYGSKDEKLKRPASPGDEAGTVSAGEESPAVETALFPF